MNTKRMLFMSLLAVTLVSCGGPTKPPAPVVTLTAADIRQIDNYDELLAAIKTANAQLAGKSKESHVEDFSRLSLLQDKLVELAISGLESNFSAKREDSGVVSMATIASIASGLKGSSEVPVGKWQRVKDRVALEETRTKEFVSFEAEKLNQQLSDSETLNLLDELYRLSDDNQWLQQKNAYIDGLISDIRDAKAEGRFDADIQQQVALVREARGEDAALVDELASYDAEAYEAQFLAALGAGDPDSAYQVFSTMAASPDFELIRAKLAGTSKTMAEYFVAKADEAVLESSRLAQAYRWYRQAGDMHSTLGLPALPKSRYQALVSGLTAKAEERLAEQDFEAALAYLLALGEFDKTATIYRTKLNTTKDIVQQAAVKKVTTTQFQNSAQRHDYGSVLSSFITQYLFEKIPNDVRIVERQQYEAILRERELSGQAHTLSAVDFLITGSVLESKVDTSEIQGKKMMRVVVGRESIPNPAYITWLEMSSKDRKKVEQPSETIAVDKHENISVGITEHRKLGIVSVGYRLVEADSGKIVFPDSISKEAEFKDNSTEGVEMGEFVQAFKLAQLPSDVEILDGLVRELSAEVGEKLVSLLSNQEEKYLAQAEIDASNSNCPAEAQSLARAAAIQELKGLPYEDTLERLKLTTVSCY